MKPRVRHSGRFVAEGEHSFKLDVRPIIENGGEPFSVIMDCVSQIQDGDQLVVIAPFEPLPLIKQLQARKLNVVIEKKAPDEFWVIVANVIQST